MSIFRAIIFNTFIYDLMISTFQRKRFQSLQSLAISLDKRLACKCEIHNKTTLLLFRARATNKMFVWVLAQFALPNTTYGCPIPSQKSKVLYDPNCLNMFVIMVICYFHQIKKLNRWCRNRANTFLFTVFLFLFAFRIGSLATCDNILHATWN